VLFPHRIRRVECVVETPKLSERENRRVQLQVRQLERREIGRGSRLLARAFEHDPFIRYYLSDPRRRRLGFPSFFRAVLHELHDRGGPVCAAVRSDGALVGVAAWAAPGGALPRRGARVRGRLNRAAVWLLFPHGARRLAAAFAEIAACHPEAPHWYLAFIGVEPTLQGKGIGRALLAPVLAAADVSGTICYLETPFPETHGFYRSLGYELTSELRPAADAPPVWSMTRMARAPRTS
jgi:GNAT superfamily N-acetyltransferase